MTAIFRFEPETFGLGLFVYTGPWALEIHVAWWTLCVGRAEDDDDA